MGRLILALAHVGAVLFFLAGVWALLNLELVCFLGACEPAEAPNRVIGILPYFVPHLIPGMVFMTVAWIVCLILLRRAQWAGWFRVVFAAPLLIVLVSLIALMITWSVFAQTSAQYRTVAEGSYPVFFVTVMASILLALVSNLIVIIAGHALRRATRPIAPVPG